MAKRSLKKSNPANDLTSQINRDLNAFVSLVLEDLATDEKDGGASPVDTGFFASSWRAATKTVSTVDRREDHEPWARIYKSRDSAGNQRVHTTGKVGVDAVIKPRFPDQPQFKINQKVFIGNTTEYAIYALEERGIAAYIQGRMGELIRSTFTDKQPNIRVASTTRRGGLGFFGGKTYVSYESIL